MVRNPLVASIPKISEALKLYNQVYKLITSNPRIESRIFKSISRLNCSIMVGDYRGFLKEVVGVYQKAPMSPVKLHTIFPVVTSNSLWLEVARHHRLFELSHFYNYYISVGYYYIIFLFCQTIERKTHMRQSTIINMVNKVLTLANKVDESWSSQWQPPFRSSLAWGGSGAFATWATWASRTAVKPRPFVHSNFLNNTTSLVLAFLETFEKHNRSHSASEEFDWQQRPESQTDTSDGQMNPPLPQQDWVRWLFLRFSRVTCAKGRTYTHARTLVGNERLSLPFFFFLLALQTF